MVFWGLHRGEGVRGGGLLLAGILKCIFFTSPFLRGPCCVSPLLLGVVLRVSDFSVLCTEKQAVNPVPRFLGGGGG